MTFRLGQLDTQRSVPRNVEGAWPILAECSAPDSASHPASPRGSRVNRFRDGSRTIHSHPCLKLQTQPKSRRLGVRPYPAPFLHLKGVHLAPAIQSPHSAHHVRLRAQSCVERKPHPTRDVRAVALGILWNHSLSNQPKDGSPLVLGSAPDVHALARAANAYFLSVGRHPFCRQLMKA